MKRDDWLALADSLEVFGDTTTAAYIRIYIAAAEAGISNIEDYLN
jgi:hypothetical protein